MNDYGKKLENLNKALASHAWPTLRPFFNQMAPMFPAGSSITIKVPESPLKSLPDKAYEAPKGLSPKKTDWEKAVDSIENQRLEPTDNKLGLLKPKH